MSSDSESGVEPFITQAALVAVLQLSFRRTILPVHDNEQAVDNFSFRTEDLLTDLSTDKEDSGRGSTIITDKETQSRNEARVPQNTKRSTTWSTRV